MLSLDNITKTLQKKRDEVRERNNGGGWGQERE